MSKASDYGVALVERHRATLNDIFGNTIVANEPETAAGDIIAYLLHWVEAQYDDEDEAHQAATSALVQGENHWGFERAEGDDIANDPTYDDMIGALA